MEKFEKARCLNKTQEHMQTDKKQFWMSVAGQAFFVKAISDGLQDFCKDYLIPSQADNGISIEIFQEDIEYEEKKSRSYYGDAWEQVTEAQELALLRKISEELADCDTLLLHAAVIKFRGNAYAFTARSGTGKSTHAALWQERFPDEVEIINDDKPFLQIKNDQITAWGVHGGERKKLAAIYPHR